MTATDITTSRGPALEVDRVVENHRDGTGTHQVQITLSAVEHRQLVGDIARRLFALRVRGEGIHHLLLAAGRPGNDAARADALTDLMRVLAMPRPGVVLEVDDAEAFHVAVEEALAEPVTCHCGLLVESRDPLITECGACADARPLRVVGL